MLLAFHGFLNFSLKSWSTATHIHICLYGTTHLVSQCYFWIFNLVYHC